MQYIQEDMDSICSDPEADSTENAKPIPRAVDTDVRMEDDSVPKESYIAYVQEVIMGYENKPIVPTSREWSRYHAAVLKVLKVMKRLVLF